MTLATSFTITMPEWFAGLVEELPEVVPVLEDRMAIVNDLARRNFEYGTGGPFSAGVFERDSGRIVSLGVNRVVPLGKSCIHAEFMAISLAQEALGSWDLGAEGLPAHQLVVNWRPCVMCFGSTLWSGVVDLVVAGAGPELEALTGFDEGPIHPEWPAQLEARGIALTMDVGHEEALAVFRAFGESDALVYNGRGGAAVIDAAAVSIVPERTADVARAAALLQRDGAVIVADRAVDEASLAALLRELLGDAVTNVGASVPVRAAGGKDRPDLDADGHTQRTPLHTDGFALADAAPDVLALGCERAARCGGGASFVIDARAMHDHLDAEFAEWLTTARIDQTEPGKVPALGPIGVVDPDGGPTSWRCSYCLSVPVDDPEPAATAAGLDRWWALLEELADSATRFHLVDGDVLVADNLWVFHGRDPYEDTDRLLWRIWAWTHAALEQSAYALSDTSLVEAP